MKALLKSFLYAFSGFFYCLHNERNMRIHVTCVIYMFYFLFRFDFFKLEKVELAMLLLTSALVMMAELINTAFESTIDLVEKRYNKLAKTVKDTASGAVLVGAGFAVLIGLVLLWQPEAFRALYSYYKENMLSLFLFVVSLLVALVYIFVGPLKLISLITGKPMKTKKPPHKKKGAKK